MGIYVSSPKWFTGTQMWCLHTQGTQGNLFFLAVEAVLGAHTQLHSADDLLKHREGERGSNRQ